jgi:hypothetical protein
MATGSIPEPQADIGSLLETVQALKRVVEGMSGQRALNGAPNHTVSIDAPANPTVGDLWTRPAQAPTESVDTDYIRRLVLGTVLSCFDGTNWIPISVAGEYYECFRKTAVGFGVSINTILNTTQFGAANQIWHLDYSFVGQCNVTVTTGEIYISDEALNTVADNFVTFPSPGYRMPLRAKAIVQFTRPRAFVGRAYSGDDAGTTQASTAGYFHQFRAIRLL